MRSYLRRGVKTPAITWATDDSFAISDVQYVCRPLKDRFPSTPDRMCLVKARWQVEWYEQLLRDLAPRAMIEVGMWDGASMALAAELVPRPHKLVGIDNRATSSAALDGFIARRQVQTSLRPYYGVDQADTERLDEIVTTEFGTEPLDLIVDDASHLLDTTRVTFNCLFPRLAPGGTYVVEDWPMHRVPEMDTPLTVLIFELLLACSDAPEAVAKVTVNRNYAMVTRGKAKLTSGSFDLSESYGPRARSLIANVADAGK